MQVEGREARCQCEGGGGNLLPAAWRTCSWRRTWPSIHKSSANIKASSGRGLGGQTAARAAKGASCGGCDGGDEGGQLSTVAAAHARAAGARAVVHGL
eukprot:141955-Chlamydomonas_euryale.AAC.5